MSFAEKHKAKLTLAERFLEDAEHSSEVEMRTSISRIYYASFHVAAALTGVNDHGNLPSVLNELEAGLGDDFRKIRDLRAGADYSPNFFRDQFGELTAQRAQFREVMNSARTLYERLLEIGIRS